MEKTIKIFISSPGDVVQERQIAKRVINNLEKEFSASGVTLEALLWEDMPLQATSSFQDGINQIVDTKLVDIAVFILWSRLGSPLKDFFKPDGSVYKSGTEYEFEMMYKANQLSAGTPSILAYIKNVPISIVLSQSGNIDFEELEQHKEAQRFIQEKFYDPQSKTVYGAYHQFDAPTSFEQKLTEHLRRLIIDKIGFKPAIIEWTGNPYVGLRSFTKEENTIFFGRKRSIDNIKNIISEKIFQNNDASSVFILGESGSGKSSLLRAGLIPDIVEAGFNGNYDWNEPYDFTVSQFRGNVYTEIVKKLVDAFPDMSKTAIGRDLIDNKEINFNYLSDCLVSKKSTIFFIDQFEELFTDPLITEEERIRSLALLRGIAASRKVWMFFSMRNDFYHKFTTYPTLLELKRESILYDLPRMSNTEFQEIVEEPAKKAGLTWEIKKGESLNKQIINDISSGIDELSLIEFALSELYNLKDENNQLTFDAYNDIGGVNGAVIKYVDNLYNSLTGEEQKLFYQMLGSFVTPSAEGENLFVRKTALRDDLQINENCKSLIDKLIGKHILTSGKDANGNATVSIVHEVLISSWKVIRDWIKQEEYFINMNNHYESLSKYWMEHGCVNSDLLQEKYALKEAEYFLYSWENSASKNVKNFLYASIKRKKRKGLPLALIVLSINVIYLIVFLIITIVRVFKSDFFSGANFSSDVFSFEYTPLILTTTLFSYFVWKKIKATPRFNTINVSLIIWPVLLFISLIDAIFSSNTEILESEGLLIVYCVFFLKSISVFIEKKEIQLWSKTSFKNSSKISFRRQLILIIAGVAIAVLITFASNYYKFNKYADPDNKVTNNSGDTENIDTIDPEIFDSMDWNNKDPEYWMRFAQNLQNKNTGDIADIDMFFIMLNSTLSQSSSRSQVTNNEIKDVIFNVYENLSPRLSVRDLRFVNNKRLDYLRENFDKELTDNVIDIRNYQYALCQYNLGHPENVFENVDVEARIPDRKLVIKAAYDLGKYDICRELLPGYKNALENTAGHSFRDFDINMIMIAENVGAFNLVKDFFSKQGNIDDALEIKKAHALLMTGDKENSLSLYRKQINKKRNRKNEIEKDFAIFRWFGLSETEISFAEKELKLNKKDVFTNPENEKDVSAAAPFIGKWMRDDNNTFYYLELTRDNHNLCFYTTQPKKNLSNTEVELTRYRIKQVDDKKIFEQYDPRINRLQSKEIKKINDNEFMIIEFGDIIVNNKPIKMNNMGSITFKRVTE